MKIQKTLLWGLAAVGAASVIFYFVRKRKTAGATIAKAPGVVEVDKAQDIVTKQMRSNRLAAWSTLRPRPST